MLTRIFSVVVSLCMAGAAYAAEIKDAPVPEGGEYKIVIFLVLFIGSCVGFFWKVYRNGDKNVDKQSK